jgi:hypothetical protein
MQILLYGLKINKTAQDYNVDTLSDFIVFRKAALYLPKGIYDPTYYNRPSKNCEPASIQESNATG